MKLKKPIADVKKREQTLSEKSIFQFKTRKRKSNKKTNCRVEWKNM